MILGSASIGILGPAFRLVFTVGPVQAFLTRGFQRFVLFDASHAG